MTIGGLDHSVQLDDDDAKRLGLDAADAPADESGDSDESDDSDDKGGKARKPANKSRTSNDK